jgi:hypothetical protein
MKDGGSGIYIWELDGRFRALNNFPAFSLGCDDSLKNNLGKIVKGYGDK